MIRLEVQPVAVYQQGKVYPVISDHLGSIRAQFSPDGKTLPIFPVIPSPDSL